MATATTLGILNLLPQKKQLSLAGTTKPMKPATAGPKPTSQIHLQAQQLQHSILPNAVFTAVALPLLLDPQDALAVEGQFGILEGRSFALVHPIVMGGLFCYTLWAGYLGWQWRRVRTIQDEINELKKQVPRETAVAVASDGSSLPPPASAASSPVESKIQQLTEERKTLLKGSFRDRHFNAGSLLLGFGVLESVGGCLNTWLRTGKLFPGPHLFAGAD